MKILVVHPIMASRGGGERLCYESIRSLLSQGHEVSLLSENFDIGSTERFFGYRNLFSRVQMLSYPSDVNVAPMGTIANLSYHTRKEAMILHKLTRTQRGSFDLIFSSQDPGYLPDLGTAAIQWGYVPRAFPQYPWRKLPKKIRNEPLRLYYNRKVARIGLVLAISEYSKSLLDSRWKRPSVVVYPACNMVESREKQNVIVTVARASPIKRLELFWHVARERPQYEFVMVVTKDPTFPEYGKQLMKGRPSNSKVIIDAPQEEYHRILSQAKVYLHTMAEEPFGIVIVEAMSASCVPIVHDSGGPREIVVEGTGFRWTEVEKIPNLVDEAIKKSPSAASKKRAEAFSVEKFDEKLHEVFSSIRSESQSTSQ